MQRKITFSVPKTQPTKCSSAHNSDRKFVEMDKLITCPETSFFNEHDTSIYQYNFDYGKIKQPYQLKQKNIKVQEEEVFEETDENTRRRQPVYKSTEIHRLRDNSVKYLKQNEILNKKLCLTQSTTALKKDLKTGQETGKKIKLKLNEVMAYENTMGKETIRK